MLFAESNSIKIKAPLSWGDSGEYGKGKRKMTTQKENITAALLLQVRNLGNILIAALAAIRVQAERIKGSRTARIVCWAILAALSLTLYTLIMYRAADAKAEKKFTEWSERYVSDFLAQREAEEIGMPPDPKVELRKAEATAFAKMMSGLTLYGYGADDYRTLAQCIACRVVNPAYPNTLIEVIEQQKQWPGYADSNEVTQKNYDLAMQILAELDAQEHPPISQDFVFASFERDGITLRDTWDITTRSHFWRAGE